jgi:hypothetical protein
MEVNKKYLREFCKYHGIFVNESQKISQSNVNKICYNFGIDNFYIYPVKNMQELKKAIDNHSLFPIPADEDLGSELLQMLRIKE